MAFTNYFGGFGQSQMLTRVRQSIAIQNGKIANLQSQINNLNAWRAYSKRIYLSRQQEEAARPVGPWGGM